MATRRSLEERFHDDIEFAVAEYGDHARVTRARVIRWLRQFPHARRSLGAKVLRSIDYYADSNVRAMARQLAMAAYQEYQKLPKHSIFFVPIGSAGSGAHQVARQLKSIRPVPNGCVVDLLELHRKPAGQVRVIVAFDDFSGTGQAIREWWDVNEPIILPKGADIIIGILVLNHLARPSLEAISDHLMCVTEMLHDANVFQDACGRFSAGEKRALLTLCRKTGCSAAYVRGRGDCGLLVAFKHGCPNNSLPILWHDRNGIWESLFQRRAT